MPPTVKSSANLLIESNSVVGSQVNPDTIDPTTAEGLLEDMIVSPWNKIDRIQVGSPYDAALVPSALLPTVHDGDDLRDILQAIIDAQYADHILIIGGVQGLPGEFVAKIMPEDIIVRTGVGAGAQNMGTVPFINDSTNGGFDNGNNWLLDTHVVPAAGFAGKYRITGASIKDLASTLGAAGNSASYVLKIVKYISGAPTVLATSNTLTWTVAFGGPEPTGQSLYFNDLVFDCAGSPLAGGTEVVVELHGLAGTRPDLVQLQIASGLFSAKQ